MMRTIDTPSRWRPWQGVILQAAVLVILLTAGIFLQVKLGITGLILTELLLLALAVIYTLVRRTPLREVFPVRKITFRDFWGTIFLWLGSILLGFISIYLAALLLPDTFTKVINSLNTSLGGGSPLLSFLTVAIVAPICEESIERGAVLSHFRSLKKDWLIMLIIGVFFGIMHTDPIRFMNTTIIGASCAYLMIKKDNILLPILVHFTNNTMNSISALLGKEAVNPEVTGKALETLTSGSKSLLLALGSTMTMFSAAPVFLALGVHLLMPKLAKDATPEEKQIRSRKVRRIYIIGLCCFGALLIGGFVIMMIGASGQASLVQASASQTSAG